MNNQINAEAIYKSNTICTRIVMVLFTLYVILNTVLVSTGLYSIYLLTELITAYTSDHKDKFDNTLISFDNVSFYLSVGFIICAITFLFWIYRAKKNLSALKVSGLRFSPGWAVGSFFIPILFFYWPYLVMKEIWQGSFSDTHDTHWKSYPVPSILIIWWVLFLMANISVRVIDLLPMPDSIVSVYLYLIFITCTQLLFVIAGILAMIIVKKIYRRQLFKWKLLQ